MSFISQLLLRGRGQNCKGKKTEFAGLQEGYAMGHENRHPERAARIVSGMGLVVPSLDLSAGDVTRNVN